MKMVKTKKLKKMKPQRMKSAQLTQTHQNNKLILNMIADRFNQLISASLEEFNTINHLVLRLIYRIKEVIQENKS